MDHLVISIGIGLVVSLLFTEIFGLQVGGMIVPGYLALYWTQPLTIVMTLAAAFMTFAVVRQIGQRTIIFGRRRVAVTMLAGFLIAESLRQLYGYASQSQDLGTDDPATLIIGFVVPGLIALWLDRIGPMQTLSPLLAASSLVHLVLVLGGWHA